MCIRFSRSCPGGWGKSHQPFHYRARLAHQQDPEVGCLTRFPEHWIGWVSITMDQNRRTPHVEIERDPLGMINGEGVITGTATS
jgi:hypothetical protein